MCGYRLPHRNCTVHFLIENHITPRISSSAQFPNNFRCQPASVHLSFLCSDCKLNLFSGRRDTIRALVRPQTLLDFITLLLLLTPAFKYNIYPVFQHYMVGVCVCMCLPAYASVFTDDFHPAILPSVLLQREWTQPVCETGKVGAETWNPAET